MKMKRFCAVFSACLLLASFNSVVSAADLTNEKVSDSSNIVERRFQFIVDNYPTLAINNSQAEIDVNVDIVGSYSYEIIITLQRSTNRTTWTDVKTWPIINGTGSLYKTYSYNYSPLAPNLYYRIKSEVIINNSNGTELESSEKYSSAIRCS